MTNPAVQAAVADLAQRQGIDAARVQVTRAEAVEWPSAGLGCPEPGRSYAQVVTPGWRITLTVNGQATVYHTNQTGTSLTPCPRS
jgi:hypothetical protein